MIEDSLDLPWIEWDGGECPVPGTQIVTAVVGVFDPETTVWMKAPAKRLNWRQWGEKSIGGILRYRVSAD